MEWFYEKNGEQHGPITELDLKGMYGSGELTRSNLVWREGMADWTAFGKVFELDGESLETASTIVPRSQRTQRGNTCGELRAEGRDALSGNWGTAVLVVFLVQVLMQASSMATIVPIIGLFAPFFVIGPLTVGFYAYFIGLVRGEPVQVDALFSGFSLWLKHTGLFLLVTFIVMFAVLVSAIPGGVIMGIAGSMNPEMFENDPALLFSDPLFFIGLSLLVLLPTIVGGYLWLRYVLVYFIACDEKDMPVTDILKRSALMMKGEYWKCSVLMLSYTGWIILGILAFFIGILWSTAYWMAGFAAYYDDRREALGFSGGSSE